MGGKLSSVSESLVRSEERFLELHRTRLFQLYDAQEIWLDDFEGLERVNIKLFDEIFGHIIGDCEEHYGDFQLNYDASDEELKFGACTTVEVLSLLALVCQDNIESKLKFLFCLFSHNGKVNGLIPLNNVPIMMSHIGRSISAYFGGSVQIDPHTIEVFFAHDLNILDTLPLSNNNLNTSNTGIGSVNDENNTNANINTSGGDGATTSGDLETSASIKIPSDIKDENVGVTFLTMWSWIQDNSEINNLLDSVFVSCNYSETISNKIPDKSREVKSTLRVDMNDDEIDRQRNVLWSYRLSDMMDELWCQDIPRLDADEVTVMTAIEYLIISKRTALPVYGRAIKPQFGSSMSTLSRMNSTIDASGTSRTKPLQYKLGKSKGPGRFLGIIDLYTIMLLLAETVPDNIIVPIEVPKALRKNISRRVSSATQQQLIRAYSIDEDSVNNRSRRASSIGLGSSPSAMEAVGELFAETTMRTVMEQRLSMEEFMELNDDEGEYSDVKRNILPSTAASVAYTPNEILLPHQYIYSAMLMIAKGYRNVPISFSETEPDRVDHIISEIDFVKFFVRHPESLLGEFRRMHVANSGLMTIPLCIPRHVNFGSALVALSQKGINSAVITHTDTAYAGRINPNCLLDIWWSWRQSVAHDHATLLESFREQYERGEYKIISSRYNHYSNFNILSQALEHCTSAGIHTITLKEKIVKGVHRIPTSKSNVSQSGNTKEGARGGLSTLNLDMMTVVEGNNDTDSDSDSSTSTSSSSNSSKSSQSSESKPNKKMNDKQQSQIRQGTTVDRSSKASISASPTMKKVSTSNVSTIAKRPSKARPTITGGRNASVSNKSSRLSRKKEKEDQGDEEEEEVEEVLSPEMQLNLKIGKWFKEKAVIQPTDTIQTALDAMVHANTTKTFVVDKDGQVVGSIDFISIVRQVVKFEEEERKAFYFQHHQNEEAD